MRSQLTAGITLALVAAIIAVGAAAANAQVRPTVYVFLNTDVKSAVLEKALQSKMPDLTVTVFGE